MMLQTSDATHSFISSRAIASLTPIVTGGCEAILADGRTFYLQDDPETIAAMDGTVLPAGDGFVKLIYHFTVPSDRADEFEKHPIIGWRAQGYSPPQPITPQQDGFRFSDTVEAIRYPDGKVCSYEHSHLFEDVQAWIAYAKQERIEWLKKR